MGAPPLHTPAHTRWHSDTHTHLTTQPSVDSLTRATHHPWKFLNLAFLMKSPGKGADWRLHESDSPCEGSLPSAPPRDHKSRMICSGSWLIHHYPNNKTRFIVVNEVDRTTRLMQFHPGINPPGSDKTVITNCWKHGGEGCLLAQSTYFFRFGELTVIFYEFIPWFKFEQNISWHDIIATLVISLRHARPRSYQRSATS